MASQVLPVFLRGYLFLFCFAGFVKLYVTFSRFLSLSTTLSSACVQRPNMRMFLPFGIFYICPKLVYNSLLAFSKNARRLFTKSPPSF
jgi:hypothetical protein